ncbi:MAG: DNA-binding transcriptional activator [Prevotella sp.]|nr:DNA-binding transcriptional activator [Prevotella sp.]
MVNYLYCNKLYFIYLFIFTLLPINILAQGLKFYGNECLINERTSYTVFDDVSPTFSDKLTIGFDMSFLEPSHVGYILRIKNKEANTIYNLSFDSEGKDIVSFKLNEEGRSNLIVANLDKADLFEHHWLHILISFDMREDSITLKFNNYKFQIGEIRLPKNWSPDIFFGRSDYIIDVPSYAIKNLKIKDDKQEYLFPLNENKGSLVHDIKGKIIGHVSNPMWLINNAYYWKHRATFESQTIAGANFDPETMEVYYFNQDSISIYNIRTDKVYSKKYVNICPIPLKLGTSFIDKTTKRLFVYEVSDIPEKSTSLAYLDFESYTWKPVTSHQLPIQLHHHGGYFDELNKRYTIFGGFGNLLYNKNFYSYSLNEDHWKTLTFGGDIITPRYFSSMGHLNDDIYIFGGMGNESGDQIVGRRYYYDFYKVDMKSQRITKLWEIPWSEDNVVPVRNMIVPNDSSFYTLCYPEHFSDSYLKLYCFSIKDGTYKILGDSIPIHSEKIKTNANLYYNAKLNELYAIVQEFGNDDIASDVKIYSLSCPPITLDELSGYNGLNSGNKYRGWVIFTILLLISSGVIYYIKQKTKRQRIKNKKNLLEIKNEGEILAIQNMSRANAIYLFGEFSVRNRYNKEINYMFSTKLMQAFYLILQYSFDHGISSQQLSEALWPDKSEDKVKNSRGVTLNHLRKILSELDGIKLVYEKGFFKIVLTNVCYCDCVRCVEIIESGDIEKSGREFSEILFRGKFLKSINFEIIDSFKEMIEHRIEPVLLVEMERYFDQGDYQTTISLTEAMFNIDPINEKAIYYMVHSMLKLELNDEVKKRFIHFTIEYKKMMGEEYGKSMTEL